MHLSDFDFPSLIGQGLGFALCNFLIRYLAKRLRPRTDVVIAVKDTCLNRLHKRNAAKLPVDEPSAQDSEPSVERTASAA